MAANLNVFKKSKKIIFGSNRKIFSQKLFWYGVVSDKKYKILGDGHFNVATPYHVILYNFRSLFYFIHISVNSWYLNKPDEDLYWPIEISQLKGFISRCLITCDVFRKEIFIDIRQIVY